MQEILCAQPLAPPRRRDPSDTLGQRFFRVGGTAEQARGPAPRRLPQMPNRVRANPVPAPSRPALRRVLPAALLCALALAAPARAGLQDRIDATQSKIDRAENHKGVLTSEIDALSGRIDRLEGEVAVLRNREAAVQADLAAKQAELDRAEARLGRAHDRIVELRLHLRRSLRDLRALLYSIYQSGTPDVLGVILNADGYDDLAARTEYLDSIQTQNEAIVGRVRDLRDQTRITVRRLRATKLQIQAARDAIAAQKRELARTRGAIESQQAALEATRGTRQAAVDEINGHIDHLSEIHDDLQQKLQAQIAAQTGGVAPLAAGPVGAPSAAGLIWPVSGPITSGYGYRWGRLHEGIDIAVPEGTPIRAAASGTVIIAGWTGGYGNYTCIDHGGGLSTCYGHQSGYAVSAGDSVVQGQIIGYSGNTGSSTGPHVHFEVRINGASTDPLGYL
jgi:murein DD-endopeptidase MepM/ murein hydrolase activator NlpD